MSTKSGEILSPVYTEDEIALHFTARYEANWRYIAKWNRWLCWDGRRWREDDRLEHFSLAREICREIALSEKNHTKKVAARTVASKHPSERVLSSPHL